MPQPHQAFGAFIVIIAAVMLEANIGRWIMESPDELSVTEFEVRESSLGAVISDAIDVAQGLADQSKAKKLEWQLAALLAKKHGAEAGAVRTAELETDRARHGQAQAAALVAILGQVKKELTAGRVA